VKERVRIEEWLLSLFSFFIYINFRIIKGK